MKISIVTATLNNKRGLIQAIASLRSQTYKNVEHIIVDGGSNDGTRELLNTEIRNQKPDLCSLISVSEADNGIYDAINKGITSATGDVIGFLHSDDVFADEFVLERVAEAFEQSAVQSSKLPPTTNNLQPTNANPPPTTAHQLPTIDAVYSDLVYVRGNSTIRTWKTHKTISSEQSIVYSKTTTYHSPLITNHLLNGWMPPHPTLFVRKEIFEKYGLYRTDMKIAADYEMILRLFWKHKITTHYLPLTTYCMTIGGASNKSLKNIFIKSSEDYKAMKIHGLPFPLKTLLIKNLSKLPQFFR